DETVVLHREERSETTGGPGHSADPGHDALTTVVDMDTGDVLRRDSECDPLTTTGPTLVCGCDRAWGVDARTGEQRWTVDANDLRPDDVPVSAAERFASRVPGFLTLEYTWDDNAEQRRLLVDARTGEVAGDIGTARAYAASGSHVL